LKRRVDDGQAHVSQFDLARCSKHGRRLYDVEFDHRRGEISHGYFAERVRDA